MIKARITEINYFKRMGFYKKVCRVSMRQAAGKMITTRWIDTDKGFRGHPKYRSRFVASELEKNCKRQDLFVATPPLETLKLLVAK